MQHKNEDLMKRILAYIKKVYLLNGRMPSTTEIGIKVGIARSSAYRYLVAMDERGMLSYQDGTLCLEHMDKMKTEQTEAPLVGSVPCGALTCEEENVLSVMTLPAELFGRGPMYLLHASGDSMKDEGIDDGDLLVIRMQEEPNRGDLIIALDEEGRSTLKKYGGTDPRTRKAKLLYCNREKYPDKVILVSELVCQGIVSHVIKQKAVFNHLCFRGVKT